MNHIDKTLDTLYMRRAIEIARMGEGSVAPNPMVGAVIVLEGEIIGEGYHRRYGEAHAEVVAIASVEDKSLLSRATLYVSLEPCSHYGKTPPCASLIVEHRIPRVVVAMQDPYPEVSGRGIETLRSHGVEVEVGVLEQEARALNFGFVSAYEQGRPYLTLKWAQSCDGYIDSRRTDSSTSAVLFSSPLHLRELHHLRMQHDAILVGYRTLLLDNPSLTNRYWWGRSPIRLVVAPRLGLPTIARLLADRLAPTWILYDRQQVGEPPVGEQGHLRYIGLDCHEGRWLEPLLELLQQEQVQSVLVEGGANTLATFLEAACYDEIIVETSSQALGDGVEAPLLPHVCLCQ